MMDVENPPKRERNRDQENDGMSFPDMPVTDSDIDRYANAMLCCADDVM